MKLIGQSVCQNCDGTGFVGYISPIPELNFSQRLSLLFGKPMTVSRQKAEDIINKSRNKAVMMFKSYILKNLLSTTCIQCNGTKIEYKLYQM